MSKAVLVMEMPENCINCAMCGRYYDDEHEEYYYGCVAKNTTLHDTDTKLDACPLQEVPEKGTQGQIDNSGLNDILKHECTEYVRGWNACIDAILSEKPEGVQE